MRGMANLLEMRPLTNRAFGSAVSLDGDLGIAGLGSVRQEETANGQGPGWTERRARGWARLMHGSLRQRTLCQLAGPMSYASGNHTQVSMSI